MLVLKPAINKIELGTSHLRRGDLMFAQDRSLDTDNGGRHIHWPF